MKFVLNFTTINSEIVSLVHRSSLDMDSITSSLPTLNNVDYARWDEM